MIFVFYSAIIESVIVVLNKYENNIVRGPNIGYIIKECFFYFNHFSLIISYPSVWLGFELFGLRVQVCSQLVQFTLVRKRYDNHHCHNKPQTGYEPGVWITSCQEEMG